MSAVEKTETAWDGPYENPLHAVRVAAEASNQIEQLRACLYRTTEWMEITEENFMQDLLQEIAGDTNIVVQERDGGWYVTIDN